MSSSESRRQQVTLQILTQTTLFRNSDARGHLVEEELSRSESIARVQVCSQLSDNGEMFSSDFGPFLKFENWSSQWLSRRNLDY